MRILITLCTSLHHMWLIMPKFMGGDPHRWLEINHIKRYPEVPKIARREKIVAATLKER